ncbi:MAG: signal peptidase II [Gallionellaceae bacterium]
MLRWLGLAALVILLDQWSKSAIGNHFVYGEGMVVTGFFNLVLAHNMGASFSMLNDAGGWQRWLFSAVAVIASVWIIVLLRRHAQQKLFSFALSFIMGGALGNLIDRIRFGFVVDFLDFHWNEHHFAAFNLADSAITCGAALLLLDGWMHRAEKNQ